MPNELVPDQWLAKLYTEVLGCAPGQASYAAFEGFIRANGCSLATLQAVAFSFLTSREFLHERDYDYAERLLILWRVGRESEPNADQYYPVLSALNAGTARWGDVVRSFLGSAGFGPAIPRLCSGQLYGWNPETPVINIPTSRSGAFGDGTGAQLQQRLDRAKPGETVWLEQGAVVRVGRKLEIPAGVTLETVGSPGPTRYAAMARLVRATVTGDPVVELQPGATLASVWVDGQRSSADIGAHRYAIDVNVLGGRATTRVHDNRIDNTAGWSNMVVLPGADNTSSQRVLIRRNLITGYATKFHYYEGPTDLAANQFGFADGISNAYGNSQITHNQFVDVTDVSTVVFKDFAAPSHQRSVVRDNTIVNAGNSGWAAFTVDPLYPPSDRYNFSGTQIVGNLIWTSPNAFLLTIAGIGTKPWFGDNAGYGYGSVRFTGNTTGSVRVNTQMAIAVSRMSGAIVRGNLLLVRLASDDACPMAYIGFDESDGSVIQQPNSAVTFQSYPTIPSVDQGCIVLHP